MTKPLFDIVDINDNTYSVIHDGKSYCFVVVKNQDDWQVFNGGISSIVAASGKEKKPRRAGAAGSGSTNGGTIISPMPGRVVKINITAGQNVAIGDAIIVVEAMKMENEFKAPKAGVVKSIAVNVGDSVEGGAVLVMIE